MYGTNDRSHGHCPNIILIIILDALEARSSYSKCQIFVTVCVVIPLYSVGLKVCVRVIAMVHSFNL